MNVSARGSSGWPNGAARARGIVVSLATLVLGACETVDSPCDSDPTDCSQDVTGFAQDMTCRLSGPLEVTLGEGESAFSAFAPGQSPHAVYGPQGGQHVFMAVRVAAPEIARSPRLWASFSITTDGFGLSGSRTVVLGSSRPLGTLADASVEEHGIVVRLNEWVGTVRRVVRVDVKDQCGREGSAEHVVPGSSAPR